MVLFFSWICLQVPIKIMHILTEAAFVGSASYCVIEMDAYFLRILSLILFSLAHDAHARDKYLVIFWRSVSFKIFQGKLLWTSTSCE